MKTVIHGCPDGNKDAIHAFQNKRIDISINMLINKSAEELKVIMQALEQQRYKAA